MLLKHLDIVDVVGFTANSEVAGTEHPGVERVEGSNQHPLTDIELLAEEQGVLGAGADQRILDVLLNDPVVTLGAVDYLIAIVLEEDSVSPGVVSWLDHPYITVPIRAPCVWVLAFEIEKVLEEFLDEFV